MLGIFDSGVGGMVSLGEVRRALLHEDIVYLADRKNAPYGTKTKEELLHLVSRDIERLRDYGASKILIACCTASTLYPYLSEREREIALPIISPAAEEASGGGRIFVIATRHTVRTAAFSTELARLSPSSEVIEEEAGELVALAEEGARDGCLTDRQRAIIEKTAEKIRAKDPDTLILGCTHFCHFERTFGGLLPSVRIINSAKAGAKELIRQTTPEKEEGRTIYTE